MTVLACVFTAIASVIVIASQQPRERSPITWAASLGLKRVADIDARLERKEETPTGEPLTLRLSFDDSDRRLVFNCREYLRAVTGGFLPLTTFDAMQESVFVENCPVLRDLKHVIAAKHDWLPAWSSELVKIAAPLLEWGERKEAVPGKAWMETDPSLHVTEQSAESIVLEDDSATYQLDWLAVGDFNADGVADIALVGGVQAKEGSLNQSRYYVMTRCGPSQLLRIISAPNRPFPLTGDGCRQP